ncbi:OmpA family protein [Novosphingobium lentum]|uniref:OmpA family protein n=1 Tax=Novosphingobium lentum TaxID=145287 RepID=UPI000833CC29|nr:OmpA family protein [Novosphingobium lentum]
MRAVSTRPGVLVLLAMLTLPASGAASAQQPDQRDPSIIVNGEPLPDTTAMTAGPEIKGIITARSGDRIRVTAADGTATVIFINDATRVKAGGGIFGGGNSKLGATSLLNGLPVTVKTMQAGSVLLASQVTLKNNDLKTATMIRNGTAQGFAEQTAATEALRGRMGDIDKYNVKNTTNVFFDTGKATLSYRAKADLCATATAAEATENALMLVVGYTDSVGSEEFNQRLSEKRAASVINYLQQTCHWKPYRMLTPTGMAEADPLANNDTAEGKAQNRRVSVNILVSKSVDGM